MIEGKKRRPQRNDLDKKGMEHLKRKNMTLTVPLWWNRMFNKRELFFFFLQQLMGAPVPQR